MKRFPPLFFILYLSITSLCWSSGVRAGTTLCFYNPETNIDNFATLRTSFDDLLSKAGEFSFQPFDDAKVFEDTIKQKKCDVYLLSSWYFEILQRRALLKIALLGTYKGSTTQSKMLVTKKELSDIGMLKNAVIASASNETYTHSVLEKIVGAKNKAVTEGFKMFKVTRDMDALMGVGYGTASAALCTEGSLNRLASLNPPQYQQLHTLGTTEKNYFLVVAISEKTNKKQMQALEILQKMSDSDTGEKILNLLGLDGWTVK